MRVRSPSRGRTCLASVVVIALSSCAFDSGGLGPPPGAECGNGTVEPGEECDDGNLTPGDGCDGLCLLEEACGPASCSGGCCDGDGICQAGSADAACGTGGAACANCQADSFLCGEGRTCEVPPTCTPGDTLGCGNCGVRTCQPVGAWGQCEDEGECAVEAVEAGADCSRCGHDERVCQPDCSWGGWVCVDQGVCLPGELGMGGPCQTCGHEERTCQSDCSWGAYACVDPDPTIYYQDADVDGYGNPNATQSVCGAAPQGYVATGTDCNDGNPGIHPGAPEVCGNCVDENCDTQAPACDPTASITVIPDPPSASVTTTVTVSSNTAHTCVVLSVRNSGGAQQYVNPSVVSGPPFSWTWNLSFGQTGRHTITFLAKPAPCDSGTPTPVICRVVTVQ